jgi:hypothetical protein
MAKCKCENEGRWISDGHGIPLAVVCDSCEAQVLSGFRSDIMERYECDEPIEPEDDYAYFLSERRWDDAGSQQREDSQSMRYGHME